MDEDQGAPPETPAPITVEELDQLCLRIKEQRAKIDEMDDLLKVETKALLALESKACTHLVELDRENYPSPHGTIYLNEGWRFNLPQTDEAKAAFFGKLREMGLFDRYATVNSQSYNSFLNKEWEIAKDEGRGMDFTFPGVPEPTFYRSVRFRKK